MVRIQNDQCFHGPIVNTFCCLFGAPCGLSIEAVEGLLPKVFSEIQDIYASTDPMSRAAMGSNTTLLELKIVWRSNFSIASNRFRHFSKPCKANRQGRLATNAPKLHDFGGGDTLWNPVHYFFVNFGDFWYISNAGCNAHFFLQLYFTIKLEVFDPISLVEGDFPAEKKTNTSRYLHLPCIIWKMWTAFLQAWWCLSVMSVHCHGRYIRMSWRLCCCCWQSWPSWDTSLQPCPTELFAAHWKLTIH